MKIKLIVVGKIKENYYRNLINEYISGVNKYKNIELIEVKDEPIPQNANESQQNAVKSEEGKRILSHINFNDYVVALCIDGKSANQKTLVDILKKGQENCVQSVAFIIGGSLGLCDDVIKRANYKMSFSKMTFPHQLMRVMLLEQLFMICDIV